MSINVQNTEQIVESFSELDSHFEQHKSEQGCEIRGFHLISPRGVNNDYTDPKYIIFCTYGGYLKIFNIKTKGIVFKFRNTNMYHGPFFKLFYLEDFDKYLTIDRGGFLRFFSINYNDHEDSGHDRSEESISMTMGGWVEIYNIGDFAYQLIKRPNHNELLTCCFYSMYNSETSKGTVKSIKFDQTFSKFTVETIIKIEERMYAIYFSKLNPNILYCGGGDLSNGKDYTLKKYNFSTSKIEKELLLQNKKEIVTIYSVIIRNSDLIFHKEEELMLVATCDSNSESGELYLLKNEVFLKKMEVNSVIVNFIPFSTHNEKNVLVATSKWGKSGNIHMLDFSNYNNDHGNSIIMKKLTDEKNEHKHWIRGLIYVKEVNKLYTCSDDGIIRIFTIMNFEKNEKDGLNKYDSRIRMLFLLNDDMFKTSRVCIKFVVGSKNHNLNVLKHIFLL